MKFLDELKQDLQALQNEARTLVKKENVTEEEINEVTDKIDVLEAKIRTQEKLDASDKAELEAKMKSQEASAVGATVQEDPDYEDPAYENAFYNAMSNKRLSAKEEDLLIENTLSSNSDENGGYLIPKDDRTQINELKRELNGLEELVNVELVTTTTGTRILEVDAEFVPFTEFTEDEDVPESDSPKFKPISFEVKDRGGILPIPNNLLKDAKANLKRYINKWLAKKQVATRNSLIVAILNTLPKTPIVDLDDMKDVINVMLDPAISNGAVIITNQDGFNTLSKLKDDEGKSLMQPDPTKPTRKLIEGKEVKKYSNRVLKSRDDSGTKKAPVITGNFKEGITLFDRQQMSILTTNIGGDAFSKNKTNMRAITREDVKKVDDKAMVFGEIVVV